MRQNKKTWVLFVIIFSLLLCFSAGCTKTVNIFPLANTISSGYGNITQSNQGNSDKQIIVFPEKHDSRAGQIEIAIMLNRLHANGSKLIALEGLFENERLNQTWFYNLKNNSIKKVVAVKLLKEGEISNGEFISLVYPDIIVQGVEIPDQYNVEVSDDASVSRILYLIGIAETSMTQQQEETAISLLNQNKTEEFIDYVINIDPWTKSHYEIMNSDEISDDIASEIAFYKEFETKAIAVGADIDSETRNNFQNWISFIEARHKASTTIANNALKLSQSSGETPITLIIGSAHTNSVVQTLKNNNAAYVVIQPLSLALNNDTSDLSSDAFDRKYLRKSVDEPGLLGSYITKKPMPFLNTPAGKSKTLLYYIADVLSAYAASGGDIPPIPEELKNLDTQYCHLDLASIKRDGNEIIFKAVVKTNDNKDQEIFGRVSTNEIPEDDLERLLERARDEVLDETYLGGENILREKKLVEISKGVVAKFDSDKFPDRFSNI